MYPPGDEPDLRKMFENQTLSFFAGAVLRPVSLQRSARRLGLALRSHAATMPYVENEVRKRSRDVVPRCFNRRPQYLRSRRKKGTWKASRSACKFKGLAKRALIQN